MSSETTDDSVITADINYLLNDLDDAGATLEFWSEDERRSTMVNAAGLRVPIRNARAARETFSLDTNGFVLVEHASQIKSFDLIQLHPLVDQHYAHEMGELLKASTGADLVVVVSAGKKRYGEREKEKISTLHNAKPARYPHADNTDESILNLLRMVSGAVATKEYPRWAAYNMWRATSGPPQDIPLAVCDARSISAHDEVVVTAVTEEQSGEIRHDTTGYHFSENHQWWYYKDMTQEEVLIFKAHDSDPHTPSRVPHSAFDDPSCPAGVPTRSSIETRAFAFFR